MTAGRHQWSMTNIRAGYLVVEGCGHCGGRSSFFSTEFVPPIDDYREGLHFWAYLGSLQAVHFDLRCADCQEVTSLGDMTALMLSTCADPECAVGALVRECNGEPRVYVALCGNNTHPEGKCVSEASIRALNEYFNQDVPPERKVTVVPCRLCSNIDKCSGITIADTGLTDLY